MGKNFVSDRTKQRILKLLNERDAGDAPHHRGGGRMWVVVRCDSAIPVGSSGNILDQCYPATIIFTSSAFTYPPDSTFDYAMTGASCLLTVLDEDAGNSPVAVVPEEDFIYVGPLLGPVEVDGSGSQQGRPRVIAPNIYKFQGTVTGTGVDKHAARWDGTSAVESSKTVIEDNGEVTIYDVDSPGATDPFIRLSPLPNGAIEQPTITLSPAGSTLAASGNHIVTLRAIEGTNTLESADLNAAFEDDAGSNPKRVTLTAELLTITTLGDGSVYTADLYGWTFHGNDNGANRGIVAAQAVAVGYDPATGDLSDGYILDTTGVVLGDNGAAFREFCLRPADATAASRFCTYAAGVKKTGATGTLGTFEVWGGVVTSLPVAFGDATLAGTQTFTGANTFAPGSDIVPITIRGSAGQTANLLTIEQNGGTDVMTVDKDGDVVATSFSGNGSGLTALNASALASGTIDPARIGTVDGGTW